MLLQQCCTASLRTSAIIRQPRLSISYSRYLIDLKRQDQSAGRVHGRSRTTCSAVTQTGLTKEVHVTKKKGLPANFVFHCPTDIVQPENEENNVTENIFSKIGVNLHQRESHPLGILKAKINEYFRDVVKEDFENIDDLAPVVSTEMNFDQVLVPADHVSRGYNDTYYVNKDTVLRCHTSAHQSQMLKMGKNKFLVTGDVYRRDTIDATHYPVFHQMEGVRVIEPSEWEAAGMDGTEYAEMKLKETLEGLARHLFGDVEMKWVDAYFPFTDPSIELEIFFNGDWMEVLGCGVMEQKILENAGLGGKRAWAFGLGLERLAMVLFGIPDIRLFWSEDSRFTKQFQEGQVTKFTPYSKYPPVFKDVAFWINGNFTENNFCELVRDVAGDIVEEVKLIDEFTHPKTEKTSHCYRITFRSMDRSLTDEEINVLYFKVREEAANEMKLELR